MVSLALVISPWTLSKLDPIFRAVATGQTVMFCRHRGSLGPQDWSANFLRTSERWQVESCQAIPTLNVNEEPSRDYPNPLSDTRWEVNTRLNRMLDFHSRLELWALFKRFFFFEQFYSSLVRFSNWLRSAGRRTWLILVPRAGCGALTCPLVGQLVAGQMGR